MALLLFFPLLAYVYNRIKGIVIIFYFDIHWIHKNELELIVISIYLRIGHLLIPLLKNKVQILNQIKITTAKNAKTLQAIISHFPQKRVSINNAIKHIAIMAKNKKSFIQIFNKTK